MRNEVTNILDWGRIDYKTAWARQEELVGERIAGLRDKNLIILAEHESVYTLGRRGREENILVDSDFLKDLGAAVYEVNRGGDITYHGPGQLLLYFIFHLAYFNYDVGAMMRWMEELIIRVLAASSLEGYRLPGKSGVWCHGRKIASLGLGFRRWISFHGLAFNVNPDLKFFSFIRPCGLKEVKMTSLARELGREVTLDEVKKKLEFNHETKKALAVER